MSKSDQLIAINSAPVIIVGAGAAGLAAAIFCARQGLKVLLLDRKDKIGAKILMSGGTRCNLTNVSVSPKDYATDTPLTVRNILLGFNSEKAIEFFNSIGVETVTEDHGKYFPATHSGRTVLEALIAEAEKLRVVLKTGCLIRDVTHADGQFLIKTNTGIFQGSNLILATGGLSFPATGSDGVGYEVAKLFGHSLIPTSPSLTPLKTEDQEWRQLSGLSVDCRLSMPLTGSRGVSFEGSLLFTHFGFSGPAVLNISRYWIRERSKDAKRLVVSFLPSLTKTIWIEQVIQKAKRNPAMSIKHYLLSMIPERLAEVILQKSGVPLKTTLNQMTKDLREKAASGIFEMELAVSGDLGYAKAEVTAGGIDLKEVDSHSLESKKHSGLYLIGEMLDVDGRIGGFNFQWAWASAFAVSQAIAKKSAGSHKPENL